MRTNCGNSDPQGVKRIVRDEWSPSADSRNVHDIMLYPRVAVGMKSVPAPVYPRIPTGPEISPAFIRIQESKKRRTKLGSRLESGNLSRSSAEMETRKYLKSVEPEKRSKCSSL